VLAGEVVERQQPVQVVADLVGGLGPLRAELGVESLRRLDGVVAVFGVADLGQHLLRRRLSRLGQGVERVGERSSTIAITPNGPHRVGEVGPTTRPTTGALETSSTVAVDASSTKRASRYS